MMLASTLFESGYWSENPFKPNARGNFCQEATINASALKGDSPFSSSSEAAKRIFSGTVHSAIVVTEHPTVVRVDGPTHLGAADKTKPRTAESRRTSWAST